MDTKKTRNIESGMQIKGCLFYFVNLLVQTVLLLVHFAQFLDFPYSKYNFIFRACTSRAHVTFNPLPSFKFKTSSFTACLINCVSKYSSDSSQFLTSGAILHRCIFWAVSLAVQTLHYLNMSSAVYEIKMCRLIVNLNLFLHVLRYN